MMDLLLLIIGVFLNVANGFQDLGNSRTEIALLDEIRNNNYIPATKAILRLKAEKNRRFWHRWGFITYGLMGIIFGMNKIEAGYIYALYFVFSFWLMRPLIFNPILGLGLVGNKGFFHLSDEGGEGWIKKRIGGKAYWIICLILFIGFLLLYYFKIDFGYGKY